MKITKQAKREAKRLFRSCLVNGVLDEHRARSAVHHVVTTSPRNSLAILSHFRRLVKLDLIQHTATVESATPLPPDLRATIAAGLTRRYGEGLTATFAHRPALIGGMRIQVGSDVYDGSVRARLTALEESF
jgi:F-type H+-transporting ATPase subunit delta